MLSQEKSESPAPPPPMPHEISAMTIWAHLSERDDMGLLKNGSFQPPSTPNPLDNSWNASQIFNPIKAINV